MVIERAKATLKAPEAKTERAASRRQQAGRVSSCASSFEQVIQLQRTLGNQAVRRLFKSGGIQAGLKIGQPNDVYEQEADMVADHVMRMPYEEISGKRSAAISDGVRLKPG